MLISFLKRMKRGRVRFLLKVLGRWDGMIEDEDEVKVQRRD